MTWGAVITSLAAAGAALISTVGTRGTGEAHAQAARVDALQFLIIVRVGAYLWVPKKSCSAFCPFCSFCISCSFSCKQAFGLSSLFTIPWRILTVRLTSLYLFGVLSVLLVLRDEKRNGAG